MSHLCAPLPPLPSLLKEDKVEVVSQQQELQEEEKEAPEESHSYQEEVAYEQPGALEQTDYLSEPQALGYQEAQTPEVLNGGSHQSEQIPSQKGVCGFYGFLWASVMYV